MKEINHHDVIKYLEITETQCINEDSLSDSFSDMMLNNLVEVLEKKLTWMNREDILWFAYDIIANTCDGFFVLAKSLAAEGFAEAIYTNEVGDTIIDIVHEKLKSEEDEE